MTAVEPETMSEDSLAGLKNRKGLSDALRLSYPSSNINLPLYCNILKRLLSESLLSQGSSAARNRTRGRSLGEYPVDAGLAHLVVAFRVDEESHVWIKISRRLADGANV